MSWNNIIPAWLINFPEIGESVKVLHKENEPEISGQLIKIKNGMAYVQMHKGKIKTFHMSLVRKADS